VVFLRYDRFDRCACSAAILTPGRMARRGASLALVGLVTGPICWSTLYEGSEMVRRPLGVAAVADRSSFEAEVHEFEVPRAPWEDPDLPVAGRTSRLEPSRCFKESRIPTVGNRQGGPGCGQFRRRLRLLAAPLLLASLVGACGASTPPTLLVFNVDGPNAVVVPWKGGPAIDVECAHTVNVNTKEAPPQPWLITVKASASDAILPQQQRSGDTWVIVRRGGVLVGSPAPSVGPAGLGCDG
jgi:hypothetical protein